MKHKNIKLIIDEPVDLSKLTKPEIKELDNKVRDRIIRNLKESIE